MVSTAPKTKRGSVRRMLVATLALTSLYIGFQELLLRSAHLFFSGGRIATVLQRDLDQEARRIAETSAAREAQLTAEHRVAAWWLGVHLGYLSQYLGSFGSSDTPVREQARAASARRIAAAQDLADRLGIGAVHPLESSTAAQFSNLTARIEADEAGIGARIEERTTPRHKHLYLMGMHVGMTRASMQGDGWRRIIVPSRQIARHATLAGLAREQWEPLARLPSGATRAEVVESYQASERVVQQAILSASAAPKHTESQ
jgi:hypothetical protein